MEEKKKKKKSITNTDSYTAISRLVKSFPTENNYKFNITRRVGGLKRKKKKKEKSSQHCDSSVRNILYIFKTCLIQEAKGNVVKCHFSPNIKLQVKKKKIIKLSYLNLISMAYYYLHETSDKLTTHLFQVH